MLTVSELRNGTVSEFLLASQWNLTLDEENISETVTVLEKNWTSLAKSISGTQQYPFVTLLRAAEEAPCSKIQTISGWAPKSFCKELQMMFY